MPDRVWVSPMFPISASLYQPIAVDRVKEGRERIGRVFTAYGAGQHIPLEDFPKRVYGAYRDKKLVNLPEFFSSDGFYTVNAAVAEIISQFDLKPGGLVPIEIFQHDQTTRVPGEFYFINFGAVKQAFNLDQTAQTGVRRLWLANPEYGFPVGTTWLSSDVEDYEVAVNDAALTGSDVWTDMALGKAAFFSDRLVQALKQAKLSKRFRFKQCKIV